MPLTPGEQLAVEHLLVEAAHADDAFVAQAPRLRLDEAGELGLGEALAQDAGDQLADLDGDGRGGADALDLPGRLDGALPHDVAADVLEHRLREELLEAPVLDHGQHVELEPDAARQGAVALRRRSPGRSRAEASSTMPFSGVSRRARSASLRTNSVASPAAGT